MISELELLAGVPKDIGVCKVYPLSIGDIVKIGEETYNEYLSVLMFDKDSLNLETATQDELDEINNTSNYEILLSFCLHDEPLRKNLMKAFCVFLMEEINYHQNGFFYIGELKNGRIIQPNDFEKIKVILQKQNYLQEKKKEFKSANDKTAAIKEKMRQAKERIQKLKKDDQIGLSDIVSIVSTYSNDINVLSVWKLTIYQLYMCYMRISIWDEYHCNFTLLPHVEDKKGLNLDKHWSTKLNNLNKN